jgi:hypothetical protein
MATTVPGKLDTNLLDNLFVRPMLCSFLLFLSAIPRALTQATQCTLAHVCSFHPPCSNAPSCLTADAMYYSRVPILYRLGRHNAALIALPLLYVREPGRSTG